ncbi:MAG: hypothetical protein ABSC64_03800 [Candidatus Korobacteraceae bacterium]
MRWKWPVAKGCSAGPLLVVENLDWQRFLHSGPKPAQPAIAPVSWIGRSLTLAERIAAEGTSSPMAR